MGCVVTYVWLLKDQTETANARSAVDNTKLVTPYALSATQLRDVHGVASSSFEANHSYQIDIENRAWAWNPEYVDRFKPDFKRDPAERGNWGPKKYEVPKDYEWRTIDPQHQSATDIRDLCSKIYASSPSDYPEYNMADYDKAWSSYRAATPPWLGTVYSTMPYLILEYWGNSPFRAEFGNSVKDWGAVNPADVKVSNHPWWALLRKRTKTAAAASAGPNAIFHDERVDVLDRATKSLNKAVAELRVDLDTVEAESRGRLTVLCYLHALEVILQWSSEHGSPSDSPVAPLDDRTDPTMDSRDPLRNQSPELYGKLNALTPWAQQMMATTEIAGLAASADQNRPLGYGYSQSVPDACGQVVDVMSQIRARRAAIFAQLTNDTTTGTALTDLLRENLQLYAATPGPTPTLCPAAAGSTPQAQAIRDFAAAVNGALDVLHEVMGTSAETELLFKYLDSCPATVATEAGQVAGEQPLEILLSAVALGPTCEDGSPPLALSNLSLAAHYMTSIDADTQGSTSGVHKKLVAHLARFEDASEAIKAFREASMKAAGLTSDKWADFNDGIVGNRQGKAAELAGKKARDDCPEVQDARNAVINKLNRAPTVRQELVKITSRVLQLLALLESFDKTKGSAGTMFAVNIMSTVTSATSFGVGTVADTLARLGKVNQLSKGLKVLGKGLSVAGAVLGIVTGAVEIADGYANGDSRLFATGVVDLVAGGLTVASLLLETAAFGPIGIAAALVAVGGILLVGGMDVEEESPMNRLVQAYVRRLRKGVDTSPFMTLLLANTEHGEDLSLLLFQLDPNAEWQEASPKARSAKPPVNYPFLPRIVQSDQAREALRCAGLQPASIEAVLMDVTGAVHEGPNQGGSGASST